MGMICELTDVFCNGDAVVTGEDAGGDVESCGVLTVEVGVTLDVNGTLCKLKSLESALLGDGLSLPYEGKVDGVKVDDGVDDGDTHGGCDNIVTLPVRYDVVSFTQGIAEQ